MPYYQFMSLDGQRTRDIFMEYDDAPDIGAIVQEGGESWRRIVSQPRVLVKKFKPFMSQSMPSAPEGVDPREFEDTKNVICDEWRLDPDSGEQCAVFLKEETAAKNALVSADTGDRYVVWDD
jgi:hypothetical protein